MNVVMLRPAAGGEPRFVEVQGTAEGMAFTRSELDALLGARRGRAARDHRRCRPRWWPSPPPRRP